MGGARLVAGRDFDARGAAGAPRVAIVNERMARKLVGTGNPLGRRFSEKAGRHEDPPAEIVGVVAAARYGLLREDPLTALHEE